MKELELPAPASQREEQSACAASGDKEGDDEDIEEGCSPGLQEEGRQHRRVQVENERLSQEFVSIINTFMERSLNKRSKFPTKRIAKILIDGILSFEWTHLEFTRVASKRAMSSSDVVRDAFRVELAPLLNVAAMKRRSIKSKAALLVECMWKNSFMDGLVKERMICKVRSYL